MESNSGYTGLSRIVSVALSPLLVPAYLAVALFFGPTLLEALPLDAKLYCLLIVCITMLVIPILCLALLKSIGFWQAVCVHGWTRRVMPLIVVLLCYVACLAMLPSSPAVFLLWRFVLAAVCCVLLTAAVGVFWNMSQHMMAAGGVLAVLLSVDVNGFGDLIPLFCAAVLLTGALGSARLYLQKSTPWQLAAGLAGGFAACWAVMIL